MTTTDLLRAALESGVESHLPEGHGVLVIRGDDGKLKVQTLDRDRADRVAAIGCNPFEDGELVYDSEANDPEAVRKLQADALAVRKLSRGVRAECVKGLGELLGVHEAMTPGLVAYVNTLKHGELTIILCLLKALQNGGAR